MQEISIIVIPHLWALAVDMGVIWQDGDRFWVGQKQTLAA